MDTTDNAILGAPDQAPPIESVAPQGPAPNVGGPAVMPQAPSRLGAILQAVAKTAVTGLQGIPESNRPSFVTGLGSGARAEQANIANQQAVKFRDMDTQIRLTQLHHQDQKMQLDTQAQRDAHGAAELNMRSLANDLGLDYDTIANTGPAVMDHLEAQTAGNGSASVPAGTHVSADGRSIYVPRDPDSQKTRDAQKQLYLKLAPALGLPSLPSSAQFVPPKNIDMLTNRINGFQLSGAPYKHEDLPQILASEKSQRDSLAKNGGTPQQLKTLDNLINIHQANLAALDEHSAGVLDAASKRKIAEGKALAEARGEQSRETNAAKPQKAQSTDWVPGVSSDEKKKAELAENMVFNANNIASILQRRPDIVGKVAGRITNVQQMAGTNDPDIVQLATDIHNIAMANNGIHGLRSAEAVTDFENKLLNQFRNGPQGIAGGLRGSVNSVQTFIDNARPDTYKTHSKNGGAIRTMVPNQ